MRYLVLTILFVGFSAPSWAADDFELRDRDRVVLIGGTLIEREQRHGDWELALTCRFPDRNVSFRNLGWSGDTVWGESRAGFDAPAQGYKRLVEQTLALQPTVIIVGYGGNEAFAGAAGLPAFQKQLDRLLDDLAPSKARLVMLAPPRHEQLGAPWPDPAEQNHRLKLYGAALRQTARQRGARFVDLYELIRPDPAVLLTDNGLHLTASGYRKAAAALQAGLGWSPQHWRIVFGKDGRAMSDGVTITDIQTSPLRFSARDAQLVRSGGERLLTVAGLAPGNYALQIDGHHVVTASDVGWRSGMTLTGGPEADQAERLRRLLVEKNRLYFYRWRPQNETYLFGFRKHEQGKNATEVPEFDPLIEKLEAEIARLRRPVAHRYELMEAK